MPDDSLTREIMGNVGTVSRCIFYLLAAGTITCFLYGLYRYRHSIQAL
jgi:hypothetical protein